MSPSPRRLIPRAYRALAVLVFASGALVVGARASFAQGCSGTNESISPCTASAGTVLVGGTFSVTYTLQNNNIEDDDFTITASGPASCNSGDVAVLAHNHATFTLNCTAGSAGGAGTVTVSAPSGLANLVATISVTINVLKVTPDSTVKVQPNTATSQLFTIQNLNSNSTPSGVTFGKLCATFTCSVTRTSPITITGGNSDTVRVFYTTGASGSADVVKLGAYLTSQTTSRDTGYLTVNVPVPSVPVVSLAPHNGDNRAIGMCVAGCFDVVLGYSTPSYTSMNIARSATLVYTSAQARPMPVIQVDATDTSTFTAQKFSIQLKQNGALVTMLNGGSGSTELFYKQTTGGVATRLSGQFDGTALSTGVFADSVIVKSTWDSGPYATTTKSTTKPVSVLVLNEQASVMGAGWSVAGLQRLYFSSDSLTLAVKDGAGSITRFIRTCASCIATSAAEFSTIATLLNSTTVVGYERRGRDGTVAAFNTSGYLTSIRNRFAIDTTKFAYDGSNRIQTITDPAGKTLTFAYTSGKLSSITDPGGRVSNFSVNASGDLASITDPTGVVTFQGTYDSYHRLTQRTDRAGNTWKYTFDFAGKLATDSTPSVTLDTTITGTGTLTTQRLGTKVRSLEAAILIDPASGYGTSGNAAAQVLSTGVRAATFTISGDSVRYAVDRFMAPLQIEHASVKDTIVTTRDSYGRTIVSIERMNGKTMQSHTTYFDGPRMTYTGDNLAGSHGTIAYDTTYDIVTRVTGTMPTMQNYLNTAATRIDSTRLGSNADTTKDSVSALRYDSRGRITITIDPARDSVLFFFGSSGFQNLDSTRTAARILKFRHDSFGRLVRTVNPRGDSAILVLDALNRVDTTIAPYGVRSAFVYDSLSRIWKFTDAKGQIYQTHYNALGWADTITDAATSKSITDRRDVYEFTRAGAPRAHIDRNHKRTSRTLDHFGRDSTRTLDDGRVTTFAFDPAGLWIAASNGESTDTMSTDSTGLVQLQVSRRSGTRYVITLTGDTLGLLRSRKFTMDTSSTAIQSVSYGYDKEWRLDTLTVGGQRTFFGYNADGSMTFLKLTRAGGSTKIDSIAYAVGAGHDRYSAVNSATALAGFNEKYAFDTLGRITQRTTNVGDTAWKYAYDALSRLTNYTTLYYASGETCVADRSHLDGEVCTPNSGSSTVQSTAYSYDSAGNRTDNSPTLIAGNRLTAWQGYTLSYDSAGNMTRKQKTGFDQYLYWNSIGQLDSAKTNGTVLSFGYDGFGRRVRKTLGTVVWKFIYDGDQILTVDSAGTRVRTFSYYPGVDQPHSFVTNAGARYYFLRHGGASTVWGLIDTMGVVVRSHRYSPFGALEDSAGTVTSPYRFAGREYDTETGLYYFRSRYYDVALARFISEDPTGLVGGVNQFGYVGGDPVNRRDPMGTAGCALPKTDGSCFGDPASLTLGFSYGGGSGSGGVFVGADGLGGTGGVSCGDGCIEYTGAEAAQKLADMGFAFASDTTRNPGPPGDCGGGFGQKYCDQIKQAILGLENSPDPVCAQLGISAMQRFHQGKFHYWNEAVDPKTGQPPESGTTTFFGNTYLTSAAFIPGILTGIIAHEEWHAEHRWRIDGDLPLGLGKAYKIQSECDSETP